jgi:hypothetical protein
MLTTYSFNLKHLTYSLQLTAYSLQLTAYSLQLTAYSLQLTAYSLQLTAYNSKLPACSSALLVTFRKSLYHRPFEAFLAFFLTSPSMMNSKFSLKGLTSKVFLMHRHHIKID